jgi:hypothetical protein
VTLLMTRAWREWVSCWSWFWKLRWSVGTMGLSMLAETRCNAEEQMATLLPVQRAK